MEFKGDAPASTGKGTVVTVKRKYTSGIAGNFTFINSQAPQAANYVIVGMVSKSSTLYHDIFR